MHQKLSFNYKMVSFLYHYKRCNVVERDAQTLLDLTQELLKDMTQILL